MHRYDYDYYRIDSDGMLVRDGTRTVESEGRILGARIMRHRSGPSGLIVETESIKGGAVVYRYQTPGGGAFDPNNRWTDKFVVPGRFLTPTQTHDDLAFLNDGLVEVCAWDGTMASPVIAPRSTHTPDDLANAVVACGWFAQDTRKDCLLIYASLFDEVCAGEFLIIDPTSGTVVSRGRKWRSDCRVIEAIHYASARSKLVVYHQKVEKRTRRLPGQISRHRGPSPYMEIRHPSSAGIPNPRAGAPGPLHMRNGKATPCPGDECRRPEQVEWWGTSLLVATGDFGGGGRILTLDEQGEYTVLTEELVYLRGGRIAPGAAEFLVAGALLDGTGVHVLVVRSKEEASIDA